MHLIGVLRGNAYEGLIRKRGGRRPLERPGEDGRMILK
jgi:hypothetical protein